MRLFFTVVTVLFYSFGVHAFFIKGGLGSNISSQPREEIKKEDLKYIKPEVYSLSFGRNSANKVSFLSLDFNIIRGETENEVKKKKNFNVDLQSIAMGIRPVRSNLIDFFVSVKVIRSNMTFNGDTSVAAGIGLGTGLECKITKEFGIFGEINQTNVFSGPIRNLGGYGFIGIIFNL